MNIFEASAALENAAKQQNPNVNPQQLIAKMFGIQGSTPREALENAYRNGNVSQTMYQILSSRM